MDPILSHSLVFLAGVISCFLGLYMSALRRAGPKKTKSGPNSTSKIEETVSAVKNPGTDREEHVS